MIEIAALVIAFIALAVALVAYLRTESFIDTLRADLAKPADGAKAPAAYDPYRTLDS